MAGWESIFASATSRSIQKRCALRYAFPEPGKRRPGSRKSALSPNCLMERRSLGRGVGDKLRFLRGAGIENALLREAVVASARPTIPYISFLRQTAAGMNSLSFPYHPPAFSLLAVSYQMCHMSLFDELSGNDIMAGKRSIGMLGGPKKLSIRG